MQATSHLDEAFARIDEDIARVEAEIQKVEGQIEAVERQIADARAQGDREEVAALRVKKASCATKKASCATRRQAAGQRVSSARRANQVGVGDARGGEREEGGGILYWPEVFRPVGTKEANKRTAGVSVGVLQTGVPVSEELVIPSEYAESFYHRALHVIDSSLVAQLLEPAFTVTTGTETGGS